MEKIRVEKVKNNHEWNDFIKFPIQLYADCPYYIPDIEIDIRNIFIPKKNPGLEFSELQPFVAYNNQGKLVGRIVGIINHKANKKWKTNYVRFGLIEFVNDLKVSEALLTAVAQWGKEHGLTAIQGPMGISDFEKEGMLIEDFNQIGSIVTIYNHPYYPEHMEALGFKKEVDWIQIRIKIPQEVPSKYARVAKLSKEMFGLHVKKLTNSDIYSLQYGKKIFQLLNIAYAPLFGYNELSDKQIDSFIKRFLPLIDKRFIPVIENENGDIIGVAITMGSLSHALQKAKGKLFPIGWFHLLKSLKWKREDTVELLLIAVHPKYQGLGVNALIFNDLIPIYNSCNFKWAETGPQLEDNIKELTQWKPLSPTFTKRRRCYIKNI